MRLVARSAQFIKQTVAAANEGSQPVLFGAPLHCLALPTINSSSFELRYKSGVLGCRLAVAQWRVYRASPFSTDVERTTFDVATATSWPAEETNSFLGQLGGVKLVAPDALPPEKWGKGGVLFAVRCSMALPMCGGGT